MAITDENYLVQAFLQRNGAMLRLHEELALLGLDEKRGDYRADNCSLGLAGALFAELLLEQRIAVEDTKKKFVDVRDATPTGEPLLDECLEKIASAKRRANASTWVGRFSNLKKLKHRVVDGLCQRGILRRERAKVLLVFTRQIYPEVDPKPEQALRKRLERAIFTDAANLDVRTVILVSLADCAGFLRHIYAKKELKPRAARLKQIRTGDVAAKATQEAIDAMNAAIMMAAIMPAMMASMNTGSN